jgi:hypothetical protein
MLKKELSCMFPASWVKAGSVAGMEVRMSDS